MKDCPAAVSVSAVLHEATCHCKSEPLSAVSHLQRGCEVIPGKTGPDLHAQVEVKLLLYSVDSKGKRHKGLKKVLTRSVYQHPTNMAVLFHTLSSSLMLCPSHDNPLPAQVPRKTD